MTFYDRQFVRLRLCNPLIVCNGFIPFCLLAFLLTFFSCSSPTNKQTNHQFLQEESQNDFSNKDKIFINPPSKKVLKKTESKISSSLSKANNPQKETDAKLALKPSVSKKLEQYQKLAQEVLNNLITTIGYDTLQRPKIAILQSDSIIAHFKPGSQVIEIEEGIFDVCRSMGKDSIATLAFIIGHELCHFFQNQIGNKKSSIPFHAFEKQYPDRIRSEKMADIHGIFVAYLAGYLTNADKVPQMISRIYESYDLFDKNLIQHDSFVNRQLIGEDVKGKADTLRHIFDLGNLSLLSEEYNVAAACFEHLLQYFQGVEIYNNLGLAYLRAGMAVGGKRADPYVYPLAMDARTTLEVVRAELSILTDSEKKRRDDFFEKAMAQFNIALQRNQNYSSAILNKLSLLSLSGKFEEANLFYNKIKTGKNKPSYQLVRTINLLRESDKENEALYQLEELTSNKDKTIAAIAKYNLSVYNNTDWNGLPETPCLDIISPKNLTKESNQFQIYPTIPLFDLTDDLQIGWKTSNKTTRWIAKWMNEDHLRLLDIKSRLSNSEKVALEASIKLHFSNYSDWHIIPNCELFVKKTNQKIHRLVVKEHYLEPKY